MNVPNLITKAVVLITLMFGPATNAMADKVDTRIGELEFTHDFANGYPTDATVKKLYDEMDFQRASQAYMWSVPLIGFVYWQIHQNEVFGAKNGQLLYVNTYDERLAMLTLNGITPYVTGFVDLQESGPYVVEMPIGGPSSSIRTCRARALIDGITIAASLERRGCKVSVRR
jgi:hypothetical protein